jgi:FKBP-type peptidyl-prolyl cis-trans isomerase FkpA
MKFKFALIAAFAAMLSLTACGGGSSAPDVPVSGPTDLIRTDSAIGTGAEAVAGKTVTVKYTGWLYSASAADNKGAQFDANTYAFKLGLNPTAVIPGFDQGVTGMKVGGKRTIKIPARLGYGPAGNGGSIPPNSGLVFDVELLKVE